MTGGGGGSCGAVLGKASSTQSVVLESAGRERRVLFQVAVAWGIALEALETGAWPVL